MHQLKLFIIDLATVVLALLAKLMPRRVQDCILDWLFHPVRHTSFQGILESVKKTTAYNQTIKRSM
jgi:hypothetical protein